MKKCCKCKIEKTLECFFKNKNTKDGYGKVCKDCRSAFESEKHKQYAKQWYQDNKNEHKKKSLEYYCNNKESIAKYKKEWAGINRVRLNQKALDSYHLKKSDPDFKVKSVWRSLLRRSLIGKKSKSTAELLGYTSETLKKHLEYSFLPGMSWDNYGQEWAIDHIIPLCNFSIETPPSVVNALSNLRPLWNTTRIVNGATILGNLNRPKRIKLPIDHSPATLIIDIDGVILKHHGSLEDQLINEPELLPGVKEKFKQWVEEDHFIILITGRKESMREQTIIQLAKFHIPYNHLIMNCPRGQRWVINDLKPDSDIPTAMAKNVPRNEGLTHVYI